MQYRKLNRLEGFDYSVEGYYFVTICTENKIYWFGKIKGKEVILNEIGKIIKSFWLEIPKHYQNAQLDYFIVMPNHIHGIIILSDPVGTEHRSVQQESPDENNLGTEQCSVPTNARNYGLLSKIIKSFKGVTVKTIHKKIGRNKFAWQRSFFDHIIRNEQSLNNIREYIINNPLKWEIDIENQDVSKILTTKEYYTNIIAGKNKYL